MSPVRSAGLLTRFHFRTFLEILFAMTFRFSGIAVTPSGCNATVSTRRLT